MSIAIPIVKYPRALEFAQLQQSVLWVPEEINVAGDLQDVLVNMTPAERHGFTYVLKLFTLYEIIAGGDYWGRRVPDMFPDEPLCVGRMASTFSFSEATNHTPFYQELNDLLNLNTKEFYESYKDDPVLAARMKFIGQCINDKDDAFSLGAFSMVEGSILYGSFGFLKHFSTEGKNLMAKSNSGFNMSVRDENLHSMGGAYLYTLKQKLPNTEQRLYEVGQAILDHEDIIIDNIFAHGEISNIDAAGLKAFARHRVNVCLKQLGLDPVHDESGDYISSWFYKDINAPTLNDNFTTINTGQGYNHNFDKRLFKPEVKL